MQALTRKLFWLAFWVVGFAVGMTGLLLHFKYEAVFGALQRDRMLMVAREIDDIAEKDLALGQDFWSIATLQDVLDRRREAEPLLLGVEVAGADGRIAYATDPARIGSSLPADWTAAFARGGGIASFAPGRELAVVAAPILNGYGQLAGYTVIRYGREPERRAMARFARSLALNCAGAFAGFTLLLFAVLMLLRRRMERVLAQAAAAVAGEGAAPRAFAAEAARIDEKAAHAGRLIGVAASVAVPAP